MRSIRISPDQRLDNILDRMLDGLGPSPNELDFLQSFSAGQEDLANRLLGESFFISDDGQFLFQMTEVERQEGCSVISGTMRINDPMDGGPDEMSGSILVFDRINVALDFRCGEVELLEVVPGRENNLDIFVYQLCGEVLFGE